MQRLIMFILIFFSTSFADILCMKNRVPVRNGKINLINKLRALDQATCPTGFSLVKDLDTIKDQQITAFAKISGDGTVKSYGGANVTGVSVSQPGPGRFDVTFAGNFSLATESDSSSNRDLLTVTSSAIADNYGVSNNNIESASNTEIRVVVFLWKSDDLTDGNQAGINVSIMQGSAPLL